MPLTGTALTHSELRAIASLTATASRDDVTPVITGIQLRTEGIHAVAVATDRYRVAELTFESHAGTQPAWTDQEALTIARENLEPVIIPAAFLVRAVKLLPRKPMLPGKATIAIIVDAEARTVRLRDSENGFDVSDRIIIGNYPPVARLFPEPETMRAPNGPVRLTAGYLATLEKLSLPADANARGIVRTFDMRTDAAENGIGKPRPVLFTRSENPDGSGAQLRYLVQPNLILR